MKILFALLALFASVNFAYAAIIFTEKLTESGQPYLVSEDVKDVAKNCSSQVRNLVIGRADALSSGQYEKLRYYYAASAKIDSTTTFLNNAPRHDVYTIDGFIKGLQDTWGSLSQLLHLQMNGKCEISGQYVKYSGSEVEKIVVKGKRPIYSVTTLILKIENQSNMVVEANEITKIQYLQ